MGRNLRRTLNLYFYTSSVEKLFQARTYFGRSGIPIAHYRGTHEPYDENYRLGTQDMLRAAVRQIRREFGLQSVFFVEDTSVRIEALSDERDFPGLEVKEWFARTEFWELDDELKSRGDNRGATVKSDIALAVPTIDEPIFFHGSTEGRVAARPPQFQQSPQYPWLSPHTFNGWFIPNGASKRLGEMEFEESLLHDFRIRSFQLLRDRIKEFQAVLNLAPSSYRYARRESQAQYQLLPTEAPTICVIGPKCSGKSTFGDYVCQRNRTRWYEASSVFSDMRSKDRRKEFKDMGALDYLKKRGMDSVAKEILRNLTSDKDSLRLVTGLRTMEELETLHSAIGPLIVVGINTDARIRFERHIRRGRDPEIDTYTRFLQHDENQRGYGLLRALEEVVDIRIDNNGTLEDYHARIDDFFKRYVVGNEMKVARAAKVKSLASSELVRSLEALRSLSKYATCGEISKESRRLGSPVRVYNTNRALKHVPEFAKRRKEGQELLKYWITPSGRRFLDYLNSRFLLKSGLSDRTSVSSSC